MTDAALLNIYCDESCHLERDGNDVMILGAVTVPAARRGEISRHLRDLKEAHGLPRGFEAKWTKVSPGRLDFYLALIDAFFDDPDLRFRGLVARDKQKLRHAEFGQDHDTWYHKMYWQLLHVAVRPPSRHRIYVDIKDTRGGAKARMLRDVLASTYHDWFNQIVERIQIVRSDEVEALQLADILVGALGYKARGLGTSPAKAAVVRRIEETAGITLDRTTALSATKFNVFHWTPRAATLDQHE